MPQPQRMLIIGFGYSAKATARLVKAAGWQVMATTRSHETARHITQSGYEAVVADPATDEGAKALCQAVETAGAVLSTVPPGEAGDPILPALEGVDVSSKRLIYLSTTGVYGDRDGGWAFEWEPVSPEQKRSQRRADAEASWLSRGALALRLGGIYGPGQSALERLKSGRPVIDKPGQVFSRIHVDDIAAAVVKALEHPDVTGPINLVDDWPSTQLELMARAAELSGLPMPEVVAFKDADLSPMAASFFAECRRVSNARAKAVLGWRPQFRTGIEGVKAMLG
ncbi:NAD(P)H-binding protein [Maricaulaceae bacterium NA33B04]|nr:NAD(P)H-binding protein [Maricaulaceae bacterium NA33B04]